MEQAPIHNKFEAKRKPVDVLHLPVRRQLLFQGVQCRLVRVKLQQGGSVRSNAKDLRLQIDLLFGLG
jgi:hypothetical protein